MAKDQQILIRVSGDDKANIETHAGRLGLSVSAYLLYCHRRQVEATQGGEAPRGDTLTES